MKVKDYEAKRGNIQEQRIDSVDTADNIGDRQDNCGDSIDTKSSDGRNDLSETTRRQSSVDDTGVGKPGERPRISERDLHKRQSANEPGESPKSDSQSTDVESRRSGTDVIAGNRDEISDTGVQEQSTSGTDTTRNKSGKLDGRADVSSQPSRTRVNLTDNEQTATRQIDYKPFSKGKPMAGHKRK